MTRNIEKKAHGLSSCCRTCTMATCTLLEQSISRTVCGDESMDFNTTFDGRKCDHTTRIPLCCKTPLERTLGELPCLCFAQSPNMLVNLSISRAVQAICAERSTSANNDGDGDGREKARTADGALLRDYASEEGERSAEHTLKIS